MISARRGWSSSRCPNGGRCLLRCSRGGASSEHVGSGLPRPALGAAPAPHPGQARGGDGPAARHPVPPAHPEGPGLAASGQRAGHLRGGQGGARHRGGGEPGVRGAEGVPVPITRHDAVLRAARPVADLVRGSTPASTVRRARLGGGRGSCCRGGVPAGLLPDLLHRAVGAGVRVIWGDRRTARRDGAGLRDVLRLVRGHRTWITVAVTLTLAASGLAMVQPLVVKWLIDSARGKPIVWSAVVLLIGLFAGQALVQTFGRYVLAR